MVVYGRATAQVDGVNVLESDAQCGMRESDWTASKAWSLVTEVWYTGERLDGVKVLESHARQCGILESD